MKFVCACAVFGVLLTTSYAATAIHGVRERTNKAGLVIPVYEQSRIDKPITEKPSIETRATTDVFRQPNVRGVKYLPHQPLVRQPDRYVTRVGEGATAYRVGGHIPSYERDGVYNGYFRRTLISKQLSSRLKDTGY